VVEIDIGVRRLKTAAVLWVPRLGWRGGERFRGAGSSCERRRRRSEMRRHRGLVHRRRGCRVAGDGAAVDFPGGGACEDGEVRERCGKEEKE
jgi:hypothetical protein